MGARGGQRPADRRRADRDERRRPRLAQLLSDQRADRRARAGARAAVGARVASAVEPTRWTCPERCCHRRADRRGAAAGRGAPARLAGVDLGRRSPPRPCCSRCSWRTSGTARPPAAAPRCSTPACSAHRSFTAGLVAQLAFWCGQASFFVVLALYLQQGRGLRPLPAGLVFTILAVAYLVASMLAPGLPRGTAGARSASARSCSRPATRCCWPPSRDVGVGGSVAALAPGLLLVGAGMGLVLAPLATTILQALEPERAGAASGMLTTMQNVGNALGVAVIGRDVLRRAPRRLRARVRAGGRRSWRRCCWPSPR